jgi:hypothetical protein
MAMRLYWPKDEALEWQVDRAARLSSEIEKTLT